jgi:CheY-like chemotaxis protein
VARILIVDDDADLALTVGEVLELLGHSIRVAYNGEEGLQAMAGELPDVILLDVEMPVMDGPSMAYRLLVLDAGRELIPVVLSSGYADMELIADRIGTPYRVRKPCTVEELAAVIERAVREKRAPQKLATQQESHA